MEYKVSFIILVLFLRELLQVNINKGRIKLLTCNRELRQGCNCEHTVAEQRDFLRLYLRGRVKKIYKRYAAGTSQQSHPETAPIPSISQEDITWNVPVLFYSNENAVRLFKLKLRRRRADHAISCNNIGAIRM